jgi:hypothetical protein
MPRSAGLLHSQDRQRFHVPALGNPEPGKDMRYIRARIK